MPLSSILEKIIADARREAAEITARGRAEADRIRVEAAAEASRVREIILRRGEEKITAKTEKELSTRRLRINKELLACKRECLDAVIDGLAERLVSGSAEEHALFLAALAKRERASGPARLQVGSRELALFGKGFPARVMEEIRGACPGWGVTLDDEPGAFVSGFVIRQKGVDHNLSLERLVDEGRPEMESAVAKALFEE